jgi:hypothetical protein
MKTRKKLLSLLLSLVMFISVVPGVFGDISLSAATENAAFSERKIKINDDWRFRLVTEQSITDATSRGLDSTGMLDAEPTGFYSVNLPHDWSIY